MFNVELRKVEKMNDNAIALYATSSGTISADRTIIGFVITDYHAGNTKIIRYSPQLEEIKVLQNYGICTR